MRHVVRDKQGGSMLHSVHGRDRSQPRHAGPTVSARHVDRVYRLRCRPAVAEIVGDGRP